MLDGSRSALGEKELKTFNGRKTEGTESEKKSLFPLFPPVQISVLNFQKNSLQWAEETLP